MRLSTLPKLLGYTKGAKRVGRGTASGKGRTAGRGTKGQKAREKVGSIFGGGGGRRNRLFKRLPRLAGIGNPARYPKPVVLSLTKLSSHPVGDVTLESLLSFGIVTFSDVTRRGVKVSGEGTVTQRYTLFVPATKSAQQKIQAAGGTVS